MTTVFYQRALADSAFAGFHDELIAYFTLFCAPEDLLRLSEVNSVFYVFTQEQPLWMSNCIRIHGGDFSFNGNWKITTFFPRERPTGLPEFRNIPMRGFGSDFLYRRWYRSHMQLGEFVVPSLEQDPYVKLVQKFHIDDLTYKDFYEQYAHIPFIIKGAITKWKASTEWTMEKLAARFPSDAKNRITHNLDFFGDGKSMQMNFADYLQYVLHQNDETPLYIFDPRFGEKMPTLLDDYNVKDLKIFREDLLLTAYQEQEKAEAERKKKEGAVHEKGADEPDGGKKGKKEKTFRPDFRWTVIGPQRSGAPWHTDPARTSAWNALLKGRKRWAIYPPDSPPPGIQVGKNAQGRDHALNMTSLYWYLHVYPTLAPHQKPIEVIQEEGEVIYVPSGWWHLVLNLDMAIAVTQNFVDSHNFMAFIKDLLDDQQDEALALFHQYLKPSRPEMSDIFRLMLIPRLQGYLNQDLYVGTFRVPEYWKGAVKRILKRHRTLEEWNRSVSSTDEHQVRQLTPKLKMPKLKSLTSRVNPTFAIGKHKLIKFFSQFNQSWGEFDFSSYISPAFCDEVESMGTESPLKKRKMSSLSQTSELRKVMTLRRAMEECFRIENATYEMIDKAASGGSTFLEPLQAMIPKIYYSGHLKHLDEVDDEDDDESFWRWPYIVIEYKSDLIGLDKMTRKGGVTQKSWEATATWISAEFVPRLHAISIDPSLQGLYGHNKSTWQWYIYYLLRQRKRVQDFHMKEDAIPAHLMRQLDQFLPASTHSDIAQKLLPGYSSTRGPVLLHGDLTDENILGSATYPSANTISHIAGSKLCASNLADYLKGVGCEKYIPLLVDQEELTMESLAMLDEAHLKELGVPLGPRLAILGRNNTSLHQIKVVENDDDNHSGDRVEDEDDWETCSSSSGSDSEDDDENIQVLDPDQVNTKRMARFYGSHQWVPSFVIDFADSKTGDPLYDLIAIFFAALHCDRKLWTATMATDYWQSYIRDERRASESTGDHPRAPLQERFLQLVLLHPSRSMKSLFYYFPHAASLSTWEEVARVVFEGIF